jgi:hypothetical protein
MNWLASGSITRVAAVATTANAITHSRAKNIASKARKRTEKIVPASRSTRRSRSRGSGSSSRYTRFAIGPAS